MVKRLQGGANHEHEDEKSSGPNCTRRSGASPISCVAASTAGTLELCARDALLSLHLRKRDLVRNVEERKAGDANFYYAALDDKDAEFGPGCKSAGSRGCPNRDESRYSQVGAVSKFCSIGVESGAFENSG